MKKEAVDEIKTDTFVIEREIQKISKLLDTRIIK